MYIYVALYGIPVYYQVKPLCDNTRCPVAPGAFAFSNTQLLPAYTPTVRGGGGGDGGEEGGGTG